MEILGKATGVQAPQSKDGREMVIATLSESATAGEQTVFIIKGKGVRLTMNGDRTGRRYDVYVDIEASLTLDAGQTLIRGVLMAPWKPMLVDSTVVQVNSPAHIDLLFDGSIWRISGQINSNQ